MLDPLSIGLVAGGAWLLSRGAVDVDALLTRYCESSTAARLGVSNLPDDPQDRERLIWLAGEEELLLPILRERFSSAYTSSVYRNDVVNAAVGGAASSRHRFGLALDFGGCGTWESTVLAARYLRDSGRCDSWLRTCIAEDDHVHCDFWDPLGLLEPAPLAAASWLREQAGPPKRFVSLG